MTKTPFLMLALLAATIKPALAYEQNYNDAEAEYEEQNAALGSIHYTAVINPAGTENGTYSLKIDLVTPLNGRSFSEVLSVFRDADASNVAGNKTAHLNPFPMSFGQSETKKVGSGNNITYNTESWGQITFFKAFKHHTQNICSETNQPTHWHEDCKGNLSDTKGQDMHLFTTMSNTSSTCDLVSNSLKCTFTINATMKEIDTRIKGKYSPTRAAYLFVQSSLNTYYVLWRTSHDVTSDSIQDKAENAANDYEDSEEFKAANKVSARMPKKDETSTPPTVTISG